MIITISGTPGSGKGTVGKMLAKKLKYKYYSIGHMRRAMAIERGMTLQEFNLLGEKQPFTDRDIDEWQKKLGRTRDNLVVEGRTSFHFIPHSVKLFFRTDINEAARRIFHDKAHVRQFEASNKYTNPQQLAHGLRHRIASDTRRYKKYYRLDIFDRKHYDLVINTTTQTPKQTFNKIIKYLANISQNNVTVGRVGTKNKVVPIKRTRRSGIKKVQKRAKVR